MPIIYIPLVCIWISLNINHIDYFQTKTEKHSLKFNILQNVVLIFFRNWEKLKINSLIYFWSKFYTETFTYFISTFLFRRRLYKKSIFEILSHIVPSCTCNWIAAVCFNMLRNISIARYWNSTFGDTDTFMLVRLFYFSFLNSFAC